VLYTGDASRGLTGHLLLGLAKLAFPAAYNVPAYMTILLLPIKSKKILRDKVKICRCMLHIASSSGDSRQTPWGFAPGPIAWVFHLADP